VSKKHRTPVAAIWTASILSVLFVALTSAPGVSIGGASAYTVGRLLHRDLLVPLLYCSDCFGSVRPRHAKMEQDGTMDLGPGLFKLTAVLSILCMALIFYLGVQPPNGLALNIAVGFLVLTAIVWFAFENRRFQGPPIGDVIAKRQAEIAAAERAIGENNRPTPALALPMASFWLFTDLDPAEARSAGFFCLTRSGRPCRVSRF